MYCTCCPEYSTRARTRSFQENSKQQRNGYKRHTHKQTTDTNEKQSRDGDGTQTHLPAVTFQTKNTRQRHQYCRQMIGDEIVIRCRGHGVKVIGTVKEGRVSVVVTTGREVMFQAKHARMGAKNMKKRVTQMHPGFI